MNDICLRHPNAKPQRSHLGRYCPECLRESFANNADIEATAIRALRTNPQPDSAATQENLGEYKYQEPTNESVVGIVATQKGGE